jgi:hypothetical protein
VSITVTMSEAVAITTVTALEKLVDEYTFRLTMIDNKDSIAFLNSIIAEAQEAIALLKRHQL